MKENHQAVIRLVAMALLVCLLPWGVLAEAQVVSAPLSRASSARNGMVRVFLSSLGNPSALDITVQGSYTIGGDTSAPLTGGDKVRVNFSSSTGKLTLTRNGVTKDMGSTFTLTRHSTSSASGLLIAQSKNPSNPYPGDLKFKVEKNGSGYKLYTIASIYIETYLYGVLPYEMGNSAHIEALKAQAVAARTYTLDKMNRRSSSLYDVVDTTNDQVYRGTPTGNANCKAAVDATKGIVVMNGSGLTSTYYTASNGGQTESAANAWGSSSQYSYLKVKDDPFDLQASAAQKRSLTVYGSFSNASQHKGLKNLLTNKAQSKLSAMGYQSSGATVLKITNIVPHTPKYASPSRLYTMLDFYLTVQAKNSKGIWQNVSLTVTCNVFAELESLMGMSINSSKNELWSVSKSGDNFVLVSRRFGHGVGLSQQGAMQMGRLGYTYDQILGFYYTGCKRMQYAFTHTIMSPVADGGSTIITTTENPAEMEGEDADCTATVSLVSQSDLLGIRSAPQSAAQVIGAVPNGAPVNVYAVAGEWCFIGYGQLRGYVQLSGLIFSGDAPSETDEQPSQVSQFGTVTASGYLNLRAQPKSTAEILGTAPTSAVLTVFSVSDGWAHIQYGALTAYASADYLKFSDTYPAQVADPGQTKAKVQLSDPTETVNFRKTPNTSGALIDRLPHGTVVTLVKNDGSWCQVSYQGQTGYIMADFLRLVEAGADAGDQAPEATQPPEDAGVQMRIAQGTTLYSDASTETQAIAQLTAGTLVKRLSIQGEWSQIAYNELQGYVISTALEQISDSPSQAPNELYATVTTQSGSLNLRSKPRTGSVILTTIPRNMRIRVLARGDWSQVVYNGYTGYVLSSFLTFQGDTQQSDGGGANSSLTAVVTTESGSLNLRELPKSWASVLVRIPQYTQITIIEKDAYWSKTQYSGHTGYVMNSFLTFQGQASKPEDEPSSGASQRAWVNTVSGSLNLRSQPKAGAQIKRTIPRHEYLTVLNYGETWSHVEYAGVQGYVMTEFLALEAAATAAPTPEPTPTPEASPTLTPVPEQTPEPIEPTPASPQPTTPPTTPTPEPEYLNEEAWVYTSNGKALNFRVAPNGDIMMGIPNGAKVILISREGEWAHISYEDAVGYVMQSFLTSSAPGAAAKQTLLPTVGSSDNLPDEPAQEPTPQITPASMNTPEPTPIQPIFDPTLTTLKEVEPAEVVADVALNMRAFCSLEAQVLREIPQGAFVLVLGEGETWCHVSYEGEEGYCMTKYLKIIPY